jgi:geranyl-CoA carboxylase alpha subunit
MTLHRPFTSVLIANRGEIAVRIVREAKALRLRAIAVYSDADKHALHVEEADAAVHIGPAPPRDSYLNVERILAAAKQTNAEAIHPGYGFLSENPDFAQSVIDAGLVWIGPSPDAIRAMGDKGNAKDIARNAGVPVIPGYDGDDQSDAKLLAEAKKIGWPVLIKAALGGGGRGQRRVTQERDFADALASAKREALSAFASDRMILEKALDNVRHIEVQVFGDAHSNIIHLSERDCSVQRRNQKIIEEAPAPRVSEDLRQRMGSAAVALAKAVNYTNAGTVEYLLSPDGHFYFLEMNTRIQVEHPVTEEVTGTNLIAMQFDVAMGKPIDIAARPPWRVRDLVDNPLLVDTFYVTPRSASPNKEVRIRGHAIEVRLCAEDPAAGFAPQSGNIQDIRAGTIVRAEEIGRHGAASGYYDSMLVKLIAFGETREAARTTLIRELEQVRVVGVRTNRNFLIDLLKRDAFINAAIDVTWLDSEPPYEERNLDTACGKIAALELANGKSEGWRSTGSVRSIIILRERRDEKRFVVDGATIGNLRITDSKRTATGSDQLSIADNVSSATADVFKCGGTIHVHFDGRDALFEDITYAPAEPKGAGGANVIRAPMAGRIIKVAAEPGQAVAKNQVLVILEAMKMEHELKALADGVVETVTAKPGDQVAIRQTLVTLKPAH